MQCYRRALWVLFFFYEKETIVAFYNARSKDTYVEVGNKTRLYASGHHPSEHPDFPFVFIYKNQKVQVDWDKEVGNFSLEINAKKFDSYIY